MPPHSLQTFVISLPQSLDRQENVKKELLNTNLEWSFLEAVDGRKLTFPIPQYLPKEVQKLLGFQLTPNEIGCFLSHQKAWQYCINKNLPTLILEDDFTLSSHFEEIIDLLLCRSEDWDLVRLQALMRSSDHLIQAYGQYSLVYNGSDPLGATAYILKPAAAQLLLRYSGHIYEPLDHYLEHQRKHSIRMLAIKPYPVDVLGIDSTISDRPNDRSPMKGVKKIIRSLNRVIDRTFSNEPWFP